jgi:hypothetical protein
MVFYKYTECLQHLRLLAVGGGARTLTGVAAERASTSHPAVQSLTTRGDLIGKMLKVTTKMKKMMTLCLKMKMVKGKMTRAGAKVVEGGGWRCNSKCSHI